MIHILVFILKIIGIVLLCILGLLLLAISILLFVPVRYDVDGSYYEEVDINFRISWLLRIFSFKGSYKENLNHDLYIFGHKMGSKSKNKEENELKEEIFNEQAASEQVPEKEAESKPYEGNKTEIKSREDHKAKDDPKVKKVKKKKKPHKEPVQKEKNILVKIKDFVSDEKNKETLLLILKQLKKILKHILPVKISGKVHFGFDEPYYTGQVLAILSIFYVKYADTLKIIPDFENEILEADGKIKGRIRLATILICVVRLLFNKNFRVLLRKYFKEDN